MKDWIIMICAILVTVLLTVAYLKLELVFWCSLIILLLSIVMYKCFKKALPNTYIKERKHSIWRVIYLVCISYGVIRFIDGVVSTTDNQENLEGVIEEKSIYEGLFYSGVIRPIIEELIFRGLFFVVFLIIVLFLYKLLERFIRVDKKVLYWIGIVFFVPLSSCLFAVLHAHANVIEMLPYFVAGLIFASLYLLNQSLVTPILLHVLNNILNVLQTKGYLYEKIDVPMGLCLLIGVLTCVLYEGFRKNKENKSK